MTHLPDPIRFVSGKDAGAFFTEFAAVLSIYDAFAGF